MFLIIHFRQLAPGPIEVPGTFECVMNGIFAAGDGFAGRCGLLFERSLVAINVITIIITMRVL